MFKSIDRVEKFIRKTFKCSYNMFLLFGGLAKIVYTINSFFLIYIIVLLLIFKLNDRGFVINYRWVMPTIKITFIVGITCLEGKCEVSQL